MQAFLPILFAFLIGIGHAFEPDHLLAVSQLVARRDSTLLAVKDGLYWGLGHTTTLVVFGGLVLLGKVTFLSSGYFEAAVGVLLITMGVGRLLNKQNYTLPSLVTRNRHQLAYAIGLLHGLAGSGALVLLVMSELRDPLHSLAYILLFGLGSVVGMFGAAALMNIPFTPRMRISRVLTSSVVVATSLLSIGYGGWMFYSNVLT
ncbi:urease accessory protein [Hymenobacter profundi]|uniref:Urease accessory protein n=1 Tax=Hymenobacter profundi TaxID=1982110 RepID=A0ABS6X1K2_9BACT|nr:urease accessory protein [Hymenobacter profundi]MBW3129529.1 urease accessory protein [Hymenobacter profundi]